MDTLTIVKNRLKTLGDVYTRMDETRDFIYWDDTPYELVKPDGKTKLDDAISITPNNPKVLAHYIISSLMNGEWQTIVEGKKINRKSRLSHYIESFIDDNLAQIDELLEKRGETGLFDTQSARVCIRSWIGARFVAKVINKLYIPECLPLDMRWTPFEFGNDGLNWVAAIYFRPKAEIELEYPEDSDGVGVDLSSFKDEDMVVVDYWASYKNEVWVGGNDLSNPGGKLVRTRENPLGYPPFIITIPPSGFMLRDKDYLKHEGEDLLFLNKGLFKELARSLSLEATAGYAGIYPSYEYETQNPDSQAAIPPPKLDATIKVPIGELHKPVPRGNVNQAFQNSRVDIQKMMSEGGPISPKAYASPPSAVAISTESELMAILQSARKKGLQSFREGLARMIIDQFIKLKADVSIGKRGNRNGYSAGKLGNPDEYSITCQLMTKNKRQEIANLALFTATAGQLPYSIRLKDILMADDPEGIEREMDLEMAKRADPAIGLYEMALQYAREANEIENEVESDALKIQSKMLTQQVVAINKQRSMPQSTEPQEERVAETEAPKPAKNILPAILGGGSSEQRQPMEEG